MQGIKNPNPKIQWDKDILKLIKSIPPEDNILLLTDANNDLHNQNFGNFVTNSGLYDFIGAHIG
eukprot:11955260-Ditylum_brightwellii.AAC.1